MSIAALPGRTSAVCLQSTNRAPASLDFGKRCLSSVTADKDGINTRMKTVLQGNSPEIYAKFFKFRKEKMKEALESKTRFQKISQREKRSSLHPDTSRRFSIAKIALEYHGIMSLTGPLDLVIYSQLLSRVEPATVFEMGSLAGGSALWMADTLNTSHIRSHVYSLDIDHSLLDPRVHDLKPDNLTFIEGNSFNIEEVLPADFLLAKPHPWVLVEDAHANSIGVLEHFHKFMKEGDYIIYDDTDPETPIDNGMGWEGFHREYIPCGFEKLDDVSGFLEKYDKYYSIDSFYTDMFGYNATNNWNGYIRRMA